MSNSDASETKLSSRSGSRFSRTSLTAIWKLPFFPASASGLWSAGKLDLHGHLVPRRGVRQRAVELRQQALRSQLDHQIGRLRALERLAVRSARVVDQHQIPVRGGPVHGLEAREALAQPVELGLDRVLGHVRCGPAHLEPLVLAELRLRPNGDLDRERELLAGVRKRRDVELGVADGRDPGLQKRPLIPARERVPQRLLEHGLAADPLHHELRRDLSLPKAGHLHVTGEPAGGALEALLDGFGLDPDVQSDAGVSELGDGGLHRRPSLVTAPWIKAAARSQAKATRRPTGPVTIQARSRSTAT